MLNYQWFRRELFDFCEIWYIGPRTLWNCWICGPVRYGLVIKPKNDLRDGRPQVAMNRNYAIAIFLFFSL